MSFGYAALAAFAGFIGITFAGGITRELHRQQYKNDPEFKQKVDNALEEFKDIPPVYNFGRDYFNTDNENGSGGGANIPPSSIPEGGYGNEGGSGGGGSTGGAVSPYRPPMPRTMTTAELNEKWDWLIDSTPLNEPFDSANTNYYLSDPFAGGRYEFVYENLDPDPNGKGKWVAVESVFGKDEGCPSLTVEEEILYKQAA